MRPVWPLFLLWAQTEPFHQLNQAELHATLKQRQKTPELSERLKTLTQGLLGAPYVLSPLGEGSGPDPDPRFRWDAFDCTTFIETALALLRSDDPQALPQVLDTIRYRGPAHFDNRRHLMTSQWIPDLVAAGYIEDITMSLGRSEQVQMKLDLKRWRQRRVAKTLHLPEALVPSGTFVLPYLSLEEARRAAATLPGGTIVNVVRSNAPSSPDVITHQGLLIHRGGQLFLRHASPVAKRVVDEPFEKILRRYEKPRKWPILGLNFLKILDAQGPMAVGSRPR